MVVTKALAVVLGFIAAALLLIAVVSGNWVSKDADNGEGPWNHETDGDTDRNGLVDNSGSYYDKFRTVQAMSIMACIFSGIGFLLLLVDMCTGPAHTNDSVAPAGGGTRGYGYGKTNSIETAASVLYLLAGLWGLIGFAIWTDMFSDNVNSQGYDWDWGYGCEIAGWVMSWVTAAVAMV